MRCLAILAVLSAGSAPALTLRVGDQKGGNQSLLQAAGELQNLSYQIEWVEFPAAAPLLEALNAGAIDAGYVGNAPFLFAYATGVPARVISVVRQNSDGLAIVVPAKSPIQTARDLKGRRIGTGRGSIGHYLVLATLERAGLKREDVNIVFLGPIDARTALSSGAIDAWATWEPYTSILEIAEGARRIATGNGTLRGQKLSCRRCRSDPAETRGALRFRAAAESRVAVGARAYRSIRRHLGEGHRQSGTGCQALVWPSADS